MSVSSLLSQALQSSPLRLAQFRRFYLGSVGAAFGYTMQSTIAAWLMATLTPSALMVALVQTASTAPALVFGLVAGALADIVDRRRLILTTQILLLASTALLGLATITGVIDPVGLLIVTAVVGAGFTFYLPAQQATVNDLVPREEIPGAVALSAVAFNVSRAVGPALAGGIAAWLGSGSAMLASALFFVAMIVAVQGWRSPVPAIPGIPETVFAGVLSGLRYARHSPPLRALIIRNLSFTVCAAALWALLPVVARDQLDLGAGGFGLLFGCFGLGAIAGALSIPRHLKRVPLNSVVNAGVVAWAAASALLAWAPLTAVAVVAVAAAGAAWVSVLASLSAGTQSSAPAWVRARAVAMNLVAMQASLAAGGVIWGWVAAEAGTRMALGAAAGALLVLLALNYRVRVGLGEEADVTPGVQLPDLALAVEPRPEDGPVLIQLEYLIPRENQEAFLLAVHAIESVRRRNGATSWRVFRDLGEEGRFVERFIITSWADYVRLRSRATVTDRQAHERITRLQRPDTPIRVSRLIGIDPEEALAGAANAGVGASGRS